MQAYLNSMRRRIRKLQAELRLQRQMQSSIDRYLALMTDPGAIPDGPVVVGDGAVGATD